MYVCVVKIKNNWRVVLAYKIDAIQIRKINSVAIQLKENKYFDMSDIIVCY